MEVEKKVEVQRRAPSAVVAQGSRGEVTSVHGLSRSHDAVTLRGAHKLLPVNICQFDFLEPLHTQYGIPPQADDLPS